jgi:TonB family protein
VPNRDDALSPVDQGLGNAFGGDDTSFTETMTGIVATVTKSLKPKKKDKQPAAKTPADPSAASSAMAIEPSPATSGNGGSIFTSSKVLGGGAIAIVAAAGLAFWLFGGSDETSGPADEPVANTGTPAIQDRSSAARPAEESVLRTEVVVPEALGLDELIDEARQLAAAGQVFAPEGNNAIELYLAALEIAPGDPVAQQGLDEVVDQSLGMAETALLERRADDAAAAIEGVELASPGNPRLPFLQAQLAQIQLRQNVDAARAAIRDSRYEDAQSAIAIARGLEVADTTEIEAVEQELSAALANERVDEVLARANQRLDQGRLIAPSNDNARYYFELALSNDPGNTAASQGLVVVASKLVLQAREQIDQGNFDEAEALLTDARRLDSSSSDLAASTAALTEARQRRAQEIQDARDRAAAERAAAERAAAEQAAAERDAAEKAAAEQAAAEQLAAEQAAQPQAEAQAPAGEPQAVEEPVAQQAMVQQPPAEQPAIEQPAAASAGEAVEEAAPTPTASTLQSSPVSISSLNRTKYVAPRYPRTAQRRGVSGWVDVIFTVDIDGSVTDVSVRDSNPGDTFVNAAINAVEKWEFEPVIEDGVAIQKRAAVRMMFAVE